VYRGQMAGWMKTPLDTEVDLGPGHIVLDWVQPLRERGTAARPLFFGFYKTRYILLSDSANCTVLRAVGLTQYRRVTDGQTDGIAIASTALAMRDCGAP